MSTFGYWAYGFVTGVALGGLVMLVALLADWKKGEGRND